MRTGTIVIVVILGLVIIGNLAGPPTEKKRPKRFAVITSNTEWSGFFWNRTVAGTGDMAIEMPQRGTACCNVQKETVGGSLTLQ